MLQRCVFSWCACLGVWCRSAVFSCSVSLSSVHSVSFPAAMLSVLTVSFPALNAVWCVGIVSRRSGRDPYSQHESFMEGHLLNSSSHHLLIASSPHLLTSSSPHLLISTSPRHLISLNITSSLSSSPHLLISLLILESFMEGRGRADTKHWI